MENGQTPLRRMEIGGEGAGEMSRDTLEKRASELAKMDGRDTWNKRDLETAAREISGSWSPETEPEVVEPVLGELVAWDEVPSSDGHAVPRTPLENGENLSEILVNEGLEEAEHDRRLAQDPPDDLE